MTPNNFSIPPSSTTATPVQNDTQRAAGKTPSKSSSSTNLDIEHSNKQITPSSWGASAELPSLPTSSVSGIALTVALQGIIRRLRATAQTTDAKRIKAQNKQLQAEHLKNASKLKSIEKKIKEQRSKGKCSRAFGWIAAALTTIVAVVATVASGGAAAPLIGVAALGITTMALQQSGKMKDVVKGLAKGLSKMIIAFGGSKSEAEKVSKKLAVALIATIVIVASIVGTVASGGSGGGSIAAAAEETEEMAEIGSSVAQASEGASDAASTANEVTESTANLTQESLEESTSFSGLTDALNDSLEGIEQGTVSEESPLGEGASLMEGDGVAQTAENSTEDVGAQETGESIAGEEKLGKSLTRMQKIDKAIRMTSLLMQSGAQAGKGAVDIEAGKAQASATNLAADVVGIKQTIRSISAQRDYLVPDMKRSEQYAASLEEQISAILSSNAESMDVAIQNMRI